MLQKVNSVSRIGRNELIKRVIQRQYALWHKTNKAHDYTFSKPIVIGYDCRIVGIVLHDDEYPDHVIARKVFNDKDVLHISLNCLSDNILSMIYDIMGTEYDHDIDS